MKKCPICNLTYANELKFCPKDGSPLNSLEKEPTRQVFQGQIINEKYEIKKLLCAQGSWTVYSGYELATEQKVVIKVMSATGYHKGELKFFFQRLEELQKLVHPGVIRILGYGNIQEKIVYVVMEFVEGQNLKKLVQDVGGLSVAVGISTMQQILDVVDFLHYKNLLYLTLSSQKVYFVQSPNNANFVKMDIVGYPGFPPSAEKSKEGELLSIEHGTSYTAPEIFYGQPASLHSDVYSAGIIFYELLAGILPFPQGIVFSKGQKKNSSPPPIKRIKPNLRYSKNVDRIIKTATRWNPGERFASIKEFQGALKRCLHPAWRHLLTTVGIVVIIICLLQYVPKETYNSWQNYLSRQDSQLDDIQETEVVQKTPAQTARERFEEIYQSITPTKEDKQKPMCYIPAGEAVIGSWDGERDEKPVKLEQVAAFYIDLTEVTNADYEKFIQATEYPSPEHWQGDTCPEHMLSLPVTNVSFYEAQLYAKWCGKRLPTELEWERAAHGREKLQDLSRSQPRKWPWGNTYSKEKGNLETTSLQPAGNYPDGKSPFGVLDMSGNVWEWTDSWFDFEAKQDRVIRGGSYKSPRNQTRTTYRDGFFPHSRRMDIGFRCVKDIE